MQYNLKMVIQEIASGEVYRLGSRDLALTKKLRRRLCPTPQPVGLTHLEIKINAVLGGEKG